MVIDKITDMKIKLGSKVTLIKTGKTKVDSEIPIKADNSAKKSVWKKPLTWDKVMTDCLAQAEC